MKIQSIVQESSTAIPLLAVSEASLESTIKTLSPQAQAWVKTSGFKGKSRTVCLVPEEGILSKVLYGPSLDPYEQFWDASFLAESLPTDFVYRFHDHPTSEEMALAWALAGYQFHVDRNKGRTIPKLLVDSTVSLASLENKLQSIEWIRTLINRPANILSPQALSQEACVMAEEMGASFTEIVGQDLISHNYPLLHAVGQASTSSSFEPRMVHLKWGNPDHFHVALIGKGITFDTGGLNIKTGHYMDLMKKDMGGAAFSLGLARWAMAEKLPLHLTVHLPIAENSIGAGAMRPSDVVKSREGLTVEIMDTDAEGRLVLADALSSAAESNPDLLLDFSTLTGAARVALGPDIPVFFVSENIDRNLVRGFSKKLFDPLWSLPLWDGYADSLKSDIADLKSVPTSPLADAIMAALFLKRFTKNKPWIHVDFMAWNVAKRPGRPIGGEAQGFRVFCEVLKSLSMKGLKE